MPADPLVATAVRQLVALEADFTDTQRAWLEAVPVEAAIEVIDKVRGGVAYNHTSRRLCDLVGTVETTGGAEWRATYLRLVMLRLLARGLQDPPVQLPESVAALQRAELKRVLDDDESLWRERYRPEEERFNHDVDFCRLRLIQFGGTACVIDAPLPRRVRAQYEDAPAGPWLVIHIRPEDYSQEREPQLRRRKAQFMEANPHYAGMYGVSWMNDPALATVSPHHFVRTRESLEHGARVFKMDTTDQVRELALKTSETRRRLYKEGAYVPTQYALVWPRDTVLSWGSEEATKVH